MYKYAYIDINIYLHNAYIYMYRDKFYNTSNIIHNILHNSYNIICNMLKYLIYDILYYILYNMLYKL